MGLRLRKSIRLLPGLRVNLSKSGASVSVGGRGFTTNFGRNGARTTIGLPGSGVSYTTPTSPWGAPAPRRGGVTLGIVVSVAAAVLALLLFAR
ncbi:MAG: hypothetical protein ABS99_06070 [Acetobacteraceae bacterium SCN 69-10]|nr:DUF4236 domain-containing protein [Rhodospirillales bacterium]ODU56300.1 MAG: hypothetical protein ABS99_06070 [Acetobacteraceae bacterium SCN 69-10]OJY74617.1 MAG: hypothetical protein BGP12_06575 [Rhodospirillales bacterium 70-18]